MVANNGTLYPGDASMPNGPHGDEEQQPTRMVPKGHPTDDGLRGVEIGMTAEPRTTFEAGGYTWDRENWKMAHAEEWREYVFKGYTIRIDHPEVIGNLEQGGVLVMTSDGVSMEVPAGWSFIRWKVKDGYHPFYGRV